jgi:hypothetical protein
MACPIGIATSRSSIAAQACGNGAPRYALGGAATSGCCAGPRLQASPSGAGCAPLASVSASPTDTAFAFSCSAAESLGGITVALGAAGSSSVDFAADAFGNAQGALVFGAGVSLIASGEALAAALPAPGSAASVSAWVRCTPSAAPATIVQWAAPASAAASSLTRMRLSTAIDESNATRGAGGSGNGSIAQLLNTTKFIAGVFDRRGNLYLATQSLPRLLRFNASSKSLSSLVGSGVTGGLDGIGTSAQLSSPSGLAISADGNTLCQCLADQIRFESASAPNLTKRTPTLIPHSPPHGAC